MIISYQRKPKVPEPKEPGTVDIGDAGLPNRELKLNPGILLAD